MDARVVERRALRALLREELARVRAEKAAILAKYGVSSIYDLYGLIESDRLDDTVVHDDLVRLDYLEYREKKLRDLLRRVGGLKVEDKPE